MHTEKLQQRKLRVYYNLHFIINTEVMPSAQFVGWTKFKNKETTSLIFMKRGFGWSKSQREQSHPCSHSFPFLDAKVTTIYAQQLGHNRLLFSSTVLYNYILKYYIPVLWWLNYLLLIVLHMENLCFPHHRDIFGMKRNASAHSEEKHPPCLWLSISWTWDGLNTLKVDLFPGFCTCTNNLFWVT